MAIAALTLSTQVPWLSQYDSEASTALQAIIDRTTTNTNSVLDPLMIELVNAIKTWRSKDKSKAQLESLLVSLYQGMVLGVSVPNCPDLFNMNGFLQFVKTRPSTFSWANEAAPVAGSDGGTTTPAPKNDNLQTWTSTINSNAVDNSRLEALQESIHTSASSYTFRAIFSPTSITPINSGGIAQTLFQTKAYNKLSILAPALTIPT